jgi:mannose-6-phosphate isomerase-like protein (cupin superfamily)
MTTSPSGRGIGIFSPSRRDASEPLIRLEALGISVRVRVPGSHDRRSPAMFETMNAAGSVLPRMRRPEDEIFHVLSGRFAFEVDGQHFMARKGDLVVVPGGTPRHCVNVTGTGARQQITMHPGIDVAAFFKALARATDPAASAALRAARVQEIERRWGVEFLGPPQPMLVACLGQRSIS